MSYRKESVTGDLSEGKCDGWAIGRKVWRVSYRNESVTGEVSKGKCDGWAIGRKVWRVKYRKESVTGELSEGKCDGWAIGRKVWRVTYRKESVTGDLSEGKCDGWASGGTARLHPLVKSTNQHIKLILVVTTNGWMCQDGSLILDTNLSQFYPTSMSTVSTPENHFYIILSNNLLPQTNT